LVDEKWVIDAPKSKYLTGNTAEESAKLQSELEENVQQLAEKEFVADDEIKMEESNVKMDGPEVVSAPVSSFLTDLKKSGDVQHHPLAWMIALLVVAPGVILGVQGVKNGAGFASSTGLTNETLLLGAEMLFDFLVIGQLVLGPGVCAAMARRKHLGAAVFVAMGSSAVLLISNQVIKDLAVAYDAIAAFACIACMSPLIIVLRNKKMQLPAGRARHTWAFLMSVSILMFASATMVAAIQHMDSPQVDNTMAWSSLLLVAGAIGWAWPRGAHMIEEVAEDIIEKAI
jgi:hypothetical protein